MQDLNIFLLLFQKYLKRHMERTEKLMPDQEQVHFYIHEILLLGQLFVCLEGTVRMSKHAVIHEEMRIENRFKLNVSTWIKWFTVSIFKTKYN